MHGNDDPRALNALGNAALARGDAQLARQLLSLAADRALNEPAIQFNLALACRACGDLAAAVRHYDLALLADPYFVHAMFEKATTLEALGMPREAALTFKDLLDCASDRVKQSPQFAEVIERARSAVRRNDAQLELAIAERIAGEGSQRSVRVAECIATLVGKQPIYVQGPTFLHVPRLPALPFFDRQLTPWLVQLEAAAEEIRSELQAILHSTPRDFVPYVAIPAGEPSNQWAGLDRSLDWSALFFWRHGQRIERACELCPRTAAILDALPLVQVPRRSPNAFFSVLRPGTRIPAHTGVSNMRSVVHLALLVPPGCGFRVGGERREWREGEAWVFDDTIEHEAWNDGTALRAVLIFDVWNPLLAPVEREHLCRIIEAIDTHYGRVLEWQDRP